MDGEAQVFLEKDNTRRAVHVEKLIKWERECSGSEKRSKSPNRNSGKSDDHPIPEEADGMQEVTPEERRSGQLEGLTDKVASLEKENGELKKAVQEMEAKMALQAEAIMTMAERCSMIDTGIMEIVQHVRQHEAFNRSVKTSIDCLENQVRAHQDNFQEVVLVLQNHE